MALLGSMFTYASKQGIRHENPVSGIEKPADKKRNRVLTPCEFKKLGEALDELERTGANKVALRAYRVLALTGCRRGEIFSLKKSEVDIHHQCLRFEDTKVGQQVRVISQAAIGLFSASEFIKESAYMFPASKCEKHLTDTKVFKKAIELTGLDDVSLHTLRHSFASVALELEFSELTIAGVLGHGAGSVTARYAHHVDRALDSAADRISSVISMRLDGGTDVKDNVVPLSSSLN